jgi:hypothetical protein
MRKHVEHYFVTFNSQYKEHYSQKKFMKFTYFIRLRASKWYLSYFCILLTFQQAHESTTGFKFFALVRKMSKIAWEDWRKNFKRVRELKWKFTWVLHIFQFIWFEKFKKWWLKFSKFRKFKIKKVFNRKLFN